jgi:hypothetical protein
MSCNIDSTGGKMKTFIAKMLFAISNKHTRGRAEGEFRGVVMAKKGSAFTTKNFKEFVAGRSLKERLKGRFSVGNFRWETIDEISGYFKS